MLGNCAQLIMWTGCTWGGVIRLNSWDIITKPTTVTYEIIKAPLTIELIFTLFGLHFLSSVLLITNVYSSNDLNSINCLSILIKHINELDH